MEKSISQLYEVLHKLTGLHRQLLDIVRAEKEALVQADLANIQRNVLSKQAVLSELHQAESVRIKLTGDLAILWKKPVRELSLSNIIIAVQGDDPKGAEQLRSIYNTLTVLAQRVTTQNEANRLLVERSLSHVNQMKKNILGEASQKSNTYTQRGQRLNGPRGSRLISREA